MKNNLANYEYMYNAKENVNCIVLYDVYCQTIRKKSYSTICEYERKIEVIYQFKNYIAPQNII